MPWLRLDDRVRTHPKIVSAGPAAAWFWFCGVCYCREHLTDGFIPEGMLASLAPGVTNGRALATKLVTVRLWHRAEGGYQVHDFLDWNPSRADTIAKRVADLDRKRHGKRADSGEIPNAIPNGMQDGIRSDSTATRDVSRATGARGSGLGSGSEDGGVGETAPNLRPIHPRRNLRAAFEHPRFDVPDWWHLEKVKGLPGGDAELQRFYAYLMAHVEAHPAERTEPRKKWLSDHFDAWLAKTNQASRRSDVPDVDETQRMLRERERLART